MKPSETLPTVERNCVCCSRCLWKWNGAEFRCPYGGPFAGYVREPKPSPA